MSGDLEECENTTEKLCVPLSHWPGLVEVIICPVPGIETWAEWRGWEGASGLMAGRTVSACLSSFLSTQTKTAVRCLLYLCWHLESCFHALYRADGWLHRCIARLLLYGCEVKPGDVPQTAVNGYDFWSAALHPNVAQSGLSLCKWPLVQRRRRWSGARGEEKGPSYRRNETAPTQSSSLSLPECCMTHTFILCFSYWYSWYVITDATNKKKKKEGGLYR